MNTAHTALDRATIDALTDSLLGAMAEESAGPAAMLFLLRRYTGGLRPDIAGPLGIAFAREIDRLSPECAVDPETWLMLFTESAAASDDPRLVRAAGQLLPVVRRRWGADEVDAAARSLEASLHAADLPDGRKMAADAVDALERVVAGAYRAGAGVSHRLSDAAGARGAVSDHVCLSSALLAAHSVTARLPYPMLADELLCTLPLSAIDEADEPFDIRCKLAQVCCRLAVLHRDPQYQQSAVLAEGIDYASRAERTLTMLAETTAPQRESAAHFGLALAAWLDLQ
jgi:hypothetical protein